MYSYEYPRAAITVDAIVLAIEGQSCYVLLIERGREPYKNKWALPGGFMDMDESLEKACIRELEEETGLKAASMEQFGTYDAIDRDPRHRTISVVYSTQFNKRVKVEGADDAKQARWFDTGNLPELAFDHDKILSDFLELRKID